jgi:hypothetical protein
VKETTCTTCGKKLWLYPSAYNRGMKTGGRFFCNKRCFGLSRRSVDTRTDEQRKADKAKYDAIRRSHLREDLREQKRERYRITMTPERARELRERRKRQGYDHAEYCRRYYADPKRLARKRDYDERRRALKAMHGDPKWAECYRLLVRLEKLIRARQPWYERAKERGYYDRTSQQRKRDAHISRH